jgi:hypothetical protein
MVVTFRVDRVKESSVDDRSTVASVGPFKGGTDFIRLDKKCKVHTMIMCELQWQ